MDNFLATGLDKAMEERRENAKRESAELETVNATLGKEFPQKDDLALVRENHGAVMRELQRIQDDRDYVSTWEPKISLGEEPPPSPAPVPQEPERGDAPEADHVTARTLKFGTGDERTEYTVSNQHNDHSVSNGHILRRTYFSGQIG